MATRKRGADGRFYGGLKVRGFARVNLVEHDDDGIPRIVGDSGWVENIITMTGRLNYLAMALGGSAGSMFVSRMAIGSGTVPASNGTSLNGEFNDTPGTVSRRTPVVTAGNNGLTATVQFAATWFSSQSFVLASKSLANIGLFHTETSTAGSMFAGTTFQISTLSTNQDVQALNSLLLAA